MTETKPCTYKPHSGQTTITPALYPFFTLLSKEKDPGNLGSCSLALLDKESLLTLGKVEKVIGFFDEFS